VATFTGWRAAPCQGGLPVVGKAAGGAWVGARSQAPRRERAIELVRRAASAYAQKRYAQAVTLCRRALALDAKYVRGYTWLGASLQKLGRRDEARTAFSRVVQLAPGSTDAARARRGLRELAAPSVPKGTSPQKPSPPNPSPTGPALQRPAPSALWTVRAHPTGAGALAWSPDGSLLATGGARGLVQLWDSVTGRPVTQWGGHSLEVSGLAWSPDGRSLASCSYDNSLRVVTLKAEDPTDEASRASSWQRGVHRAVQSNPADLNALAWSRDGRFLAVGAGDGVVSVWDAPTLREASSLRMRALLKSHSGGVNSVAWLPSAGAASGAVPEVVSGGADGTLRVWSLKLGNGVASSSASERINLPTGASVLAAVSPSGAIATGSGPLVQLRSAGTGKVERSFVLDKASVRSLAFAPQRDLLAVGTYQFSVRLFNARTASADVTLTGLSSEVRALAWSPDGKKLAAIGADGTLKLWPVP
jgi:WD40 repeat protein